MDRYDPEVSDRTLVFAIKIDELALLLAGEPDEEVALLLDAVSETLGEVLTEVERDLFVVAIRRRKDQIERNAGMPLRCQ